MSQFKNMLFKKDKTLTASISRSVIYIVNHFGKSRKIPNQATLQLAPINCVLTLILFSVLHFQGVMWLFNNQSSCFLFILLNKAAITAKALQATHSNSNAALRNICEIKFNEISKYYICKSWLLDSALESKASFPSPDQSTSGSSV